MAQEFEKNDTEFGQGDDSEHVNIVEVRQLVQFSRTEVRSEHVWLERLALPCALEAALAALASLPADRLVSAADGTALTVALRTLPEAGRADPLRALLCRLATVDSEEAVLLALQLWHLYDNDCAPAVERARCLLGCPALLERLALTAVRRRGSLTPLARLAAASEPLAARLFRLARVVFESSGGCGASAAVAARLAADALPQLPPPPLQAPAAALLLGAGGAAAALERLCRRRRGPAHVRWLAALYPRHVRALCRQEALRCCPRLRRVLRGAGDPPF